MTVPKLNQDPSKYDSLGYCVFRGVLDATAVASVQQDLAKVLEAIPAKMMVYKDGKHVEADGRPEFLVEPHAKERGEPWLELCRHPRVLDAVESILGPDLILIMSHLIVKRPSDGLAVAWHQDNTYWHSVQGTEVCTVWLAIDDADTDNGCMNVIPCTQANHPDMEKISTGGEDLLGTTVAVSQLQAGRAVPIERKAGDLSVHDSFIIHGAETNQSGRRRAGYTMRYANAATVTVDLNEHWVEVFRVRGNPHAAESYTDLRPGKRSHDG